MYELNGIRMVRNDRAILSIDHLEIPTHELTLILGHNGSGKSTLASIISGLVKPDAGTTKLEGCDLFTLSERERAQRAAFLPQKLPASEGLTCRELVRLGRFPWRGLFGRWRAEDEAAVDEALAATGTAQYAQSYVDDLSGGRTAARLDIDASRASFTRNDSRRTDFRAGRSSPIRDTGASGAP